MGSDAPGTPRMIQDAAKAVVKQHGGKFPGGIAGLASCPASAVTRPRPLPALSSELPAAVVDGNVERVLGRVFGTGLTGEGFWQTADTPAQSQASPAISTRP